MTLDQFAALANLLRLRDGPAQDVARMVMVDGLTVSEAARATGVSLQAASNSAQRCRRGLELARTVVSGPPSHQT